MVGRGKSTSLAETEFGRIWPGAGSVDDFWRDIRRWTCGTNHSSRMSSRLLTEGGFSRLTAFFIIPFILSSAIKFFRLRGRWWKVGKKAGSSSKRQGEGWKTCSGEMGTGWDWRLFARDFRIHHQTDNAPRDVWVDILRQRWRIHHYGWGHLCLRGRRPQSSLFHYGVLCYLHIPPTGGYGNFVVLASIER